MAAVASYACTRNFTDATGYSPSCDVHAAPDEWLPWHVIVEYFTYNPWVFSLLGSTMVGLTGIFPLWLIPIEDGVDLKTGGSDSKVSDVDGQPYTTLLYSNGPGYTHPRNILREAGKDSIQTAGVPRAWATHGGEDVPVFAIGPLAGALFSGSVDQSYIPHAIAYAACLAHHASRCSRDPTNSANASDTMNAAPISCPSAEPNSAAISSDVMNDRMRNPPTKSTAGPCSSPTGSPTQLSLLLLPLLLLLLSPLTASMLAVLPISRRPFERTS